jgi:hypothetical protein
MGAAGMAGDYGQAGAVIGGFLESAPLPVSPDRFRFFSLRPP